MTLLNPKRTTVKILHISPYALRGGCEKNCFHFIKEAADHINELIILGEEGPMSAEWRELGIESVHLGILELSPYKFWISLKKEMAGKKYDLVIYWSTVRLPLVLSAISASTDTVKLYLGNPSSYTPVQIAQVLLLNRFLSRPGHITLMPCSEYVGRSFSKLPYFNQFASKTSLNPVEIPAVNPKASCLLNQPARLGMVARLDPIKNHSLLLEAFSIALKKKPLLELHLLGDGELKEQLIRQAGSLDISSKVIFHGDVKDVYAHLRQWDVFVYSTTDKEGLGSAVIEAMANGLPCVLCDLPMLKELVSSEIDVAWFTCTDKNDLADTLISLLNDTSRRKAMSEALFENARQRFTPKRFIADYLN